MGDTVEDVGLHSYGHTAVDLRDDAPSHQFQQHHTRSRIENLPRRRAISFIFEVRVADAPFLFTPTPRLWSMLAIREP